MKTLGIIGTAGRKDDRTRMTQSLYKDMCGYAAVFANTYGGPIKVVSGGAAWADHVGVTLFLRKIVQGLKLCLPAEFKDGQFIEGSNRFDPGRTSNWYHKQMSQALGHNTLRDIALAAEAGAILHTIPGFKKRNLHVASEATDYLLAFTFGTHSGTYSQEDEGWLDATAAGLKDGGTAHTWSKARSAIKEHVALWKN